MKKIILLIALLAIVAALSGCVLDNPANVMNSNNSDSGNVNLGADNVKSVEKGDTIKVEYIGRFPDGEVFDKSEGRGPLEFVVGAGQMIKGFDEAVVGMKLNGEKTVSIPPEKAYGTADSGQRFEVPISQIGGDANVEVGSKLYTTTGQQVTVIEINDGNATVELIHPLAGKTLEFWIKVVEITKG